MLVVAVVFIQTHVSNPTYDDKRVTAGDSAIGDAAIAADIVVACSGKSWAGELALFFIVGRVGARSGQGILEGLTYRQVAYSQNISENKQITLIVSGNSIH